jgi:hypothetical protein
MPPRNLGNINPGLLGQQPLISRPALLGERNVSPSSANIRANTLAGSNSSGLS